MKKIISLLLAICMCISFGAMLTACNNEDNEDNNIKTTVTEQEWTAAFDTFSNENFFVHYKVGDVEILETVTSTAIKKVLKDEGVEYTTYYAEENGMSVVYECENSIWTKSVEYSNEWVNGESVPSEPIAWSTKLTSEKEDIISDVLPFARFEFELFTYNEESKAYECERMLAKGDYGIVFTDFVNIKIAFENGKVASIYYDIEAAGTIQETLIVSCAAEDLAFTLPEVNQ